MKTATNLDELTLEGEEVHFLKSKRMIKVNGDSKACFEKLLLSTEKEVIILAQNWRDDIFSEEYGLIFSEFLKSNIPMTIILGDHKKSRAPEFLRKYVGSRKSHLGVLIAQKELCVSLFRWNDPMQPEFPVIGDSDMYHVRFKDSFTQPGKTINYSATSYDDPRAVRSIRSRIDVICQSDLVKRY